MSAGTGIFVVGGSSASDAERLQPGELTSRTFCNDDAVVIELGQEGIALSRELRERGFVGALIVVLPSDRSELRAAALDAGADDCLSGPADLQELAARIDAVLRRRRSDRRRTLQAFGVELDLATGRAWRGARALSLSRTEILLLELFLRNPRQVLPRSLIAERVWPERELARSEALIEVYVGYLRRKLEAAGESRLIQTARGVGYALSDRAAA